MDTNGLVRMANKSEWPRRNGMAGNNHQPEFESRLYEADAPETRAWLSLWNEWKPDLFVDCHVTDGADYQYNITYQYEHFSNVSPLIVSWERKVFDGVVAPATEAAGNLGLFLPGVPLTTEI